MESILQKMDLTYKFHPVKLDPLKVKAYLTSLPVPYNQQAQNVIENTLAVSTSDTIASIDRSVNRALEYIGSRDFYVFINMTKIGSEHYFLAVFSDIFDLPNYKGLVTNPGNTTKISVPLITEVVKGTEPVIILNLDDCVYSGISQFGLIDESLTDIRHKLYGKDYHYIYKKGVSPFLNINLTWVVAVGYSSERARDFLTENFPGLILFYDTLVKDVPLPVKPWKYETEDFVSEDGSTYVSTPIMFDHKISTDKRTAFPVIYLDGYNPETQISTGKLVNRIPSRDLYVYMEKLINGSE